MTKEELSMIKSIDELVCLIDKTPWGYFLRILQPLVQKSA